MTTPANGYFISGRGWYCLSHHMRLDKDGGCSCCGSHVQIRREAERQAAAAAAAAEQAKPPPLRTFADRQRLHHALVESDPDLEGIDSWTGIDS